MNPTTEKRGVFISIEGMDGSGKSVGAGYFTQCLRDLGMELIATREIGGTPYGEKIRSMSLQADQPIDPMSRLLAFLASRNQHIVEVIRPNIAKGISVVSDRFNDSTYVYQGVVDNLIPQYRELMATRSLAHLGIRSDVTVFFKVDPDVAFERGASRENLDNDQYKKNRDFAHKIAAAYESIYSGLSAAQRANIFFIDGNQTIEEVQMALKKTARRIFDGYSYPY